MNLEQVQNLEHVGYARFVHGNGDNQSISEQAWGAVVQNVRQLDSNRINLHTTIQ